MRGFLELIERLWAFVIRVALMGGAVAIVFFILVFGYWALTGSKKGEIVFSSGPRPTASTSASSRSEPDSLALEAKPRASAAAPDREQLAAARPALRLNAPQLTPDQECRRGLEKKGVVLPPRATCIDVETVIKNLATAVYRFNKPEEAYVDEPFRVVLVLPTAANQDLATPFMSTQGAIEKRTAPYAQNMEATLRGDPDLKISPAGPQERVTTALQPTTWEWTVTPEKYGEKTLVIEVNAQLVLGTDRSRVQLRTIYESIKVQVHFGHWLLASALWFVTSIYGLLVGLATIAIGGLGTLHYVRHRKTEEVQGADLLAHQNHKPHDPGTGASH